MKPGERMCLMEEDADTEPWVHQWEKGQCDRSLEGVRERVGQ